MVGRAFDESGVVVQQLVRGLFQLDRTADQLWWFLDVGHFSFLLWFSYLLEILDAAKCVTRCA